MPNVRVVELFEKQFDGNGNVTLIAECNEYNEVGLRVKQLSRSPFTFNDTLTDEEIVALIKEGVYSIYF